MIRLLELWITVDDGEAEGLALDVLGMLLMVGLGFAERGVDDLELFGGVDFVGSGVAGGLEGSHKGFGGMDFVGEALPSI